MNIPARYQKRHEEGKWATNFICYKLKLRKITCLNRSANQEDSANMEAPDNKSDHAKLKTQNSGSQVIESPIQSEGVD